MGDRLSNESDEGEAPQAPQALSERDAEVVQRIEQERLTGFSFDGLRRITGAHPETLSRVLGRLEEVGVITRVPEGYAITDRARGQASLNPTDYERTRVPLLHTLLPYDSRQPLVVQALKGRWFDKLRWVGTSQTEEGITLKWVTEDGAVQLDARFSQGQLDIDARLKSGTEVSTAIRVAHQLMNRISRLYSSTGPRSRMMFTVTADSRFQPAAM